MFYEAGLVRCSTDKSARWSRLTSWVWPWNTDWKESTNSWKLSFNSHICRRQSHIHMQTVLYTHLYTHTHTPHPIHTKNYYRIILGVYSWRDDSIIKSTSYSWRGPGFSSRHSQCQLTIICNSHSERSISCLMLPNLCHHIWLHQVFYIVLNPGKDLSKLSIVQQRLQKVQVQGPEEITPMCYAVTSRSTLCQMNWNPCVSISHTEG